MPAQHYCLRWKNHHSNVQNMFTQLLEKDRFCDVRILCGGVSLRAHRAVLASCSALLSSLLTGGSGDDPPDATDTVLVVDGADPDDVAALLRYMYTGEISVHHTQLTSLLKTAEELRIKGLAEIRWAGGAVSHDPETSTHLPPNILDDTLKYIHDKKDDKPQTAENNRISQPQNEKIDSRRDSGNDDLDKEKDSEKEDTTTLQENGSADEERTLVIPPSCSVINGGPPPLKWITDKSNPPAVSCLTEEDKKRSHQDNGCESEPPASPKRMKIEAQNLTITNRLTNSSHKTDRHPDSSKDGIKFEPEVNLDSTEGSCEQGESEEEDYDGSGHDITRFLDTSFREGDDDMSNDGCELVPTTHNRLSPTPGQSNSIAGTSSSGHYPNSMTPSGCTKVDPRYSDVIKLNDYLRNGRRQQFWEQEYVLRVMEGVRSKDLEMKQAAEILGVSYGTLYGRYRDVYGCINRPYSNHTRTQDFWTEQSATKILLRLRRGEVALSTAAEALGVSPNLLAANMSRIGESAGTFSDEGESSRDLIQITPSPIAQPPTEPRPRGRPPRILPPATLNANYAASLVNAQKTSQRSSDESDPLPLPSHSPPLMSVSPAPALPLHMGRRGRPRYALGPSPTNTNYIPIAPAPMLNPTGSPNVKTIRRNLACAEMIVRKIITTYDNKPFRGPDLEISPTKEIDLDLGCSSSDVDANVSILRSRPELTIVSSAKKDTTVPTTSGGGSVT